MKYLRNSPEIILTLEADNPRLITWWIDASYACHHDMRSHTGGAMTLGKGAMYSTSTRQKLNTRSSIEAELVAVNDVMGQVLWTQYFLMAQGIDVNDNIVYQDNQSAILLETNGKGSSGKRTRHMNVQYFFIKDRIQSGELTMHFLRNDCRFLYKAITRCSAFEIP
jgi:hypothetical protein